MSKLAGENHKLRKCGRQEYLLRPRGAMLPLWSHDGRQGGQQVKYMLVVPEVPSRHHGRYRQNHQSAALQDVQQV